LIDESGNNLGITDTYKAMYMASNVGLDLVEVAQKDNLPLCKILDYGKYKYEQAKTKKSQQPKNIVKELKMSPRIDSHDIEIKIKKVKEWLQDGCKVYVAIQFRGRENTHHENGYNIINKFTPLGNSTQPKLEGNTLSIWLTR